MSAAEQKILVIDDSTTVLRMTCERLAQSGFMPLPASSVEEALEAHAGEPVLLIICDLVLPGVGGVAGISLMQRQWPGVRVVAMSAGSGSVEAHDLLDIARHAGAERLLCKPFSAQDLLEVVNDLLLENAATQSPEAVVPVSPSAADAPGEAQERRILVIDDSTTLRRLFSRLLAANGYACMSVARMEEALAMPHDSYIDCIVTDIFMPGRGGLAGIADLRARWPEVPIIAMSGGREGEMNAEAVLTSARRQGADAALRKPFPPQALLRTLERLLDRMGDEVCEI